MENDIHATLRKALTVTQKIVPEIDLQLEEGDRLFRMNEVPLKSWYFYLNAMSCAASILHKSIKKLPDTNHTCEMEYVANDLYCLIESLNVFYICYMKNSEEKGTEKESCERYSRYRRFLDAE